MSNGSGSPSPEQTPKVPSKRGRSSDRENSNSPSSKRMCGRSRSISRHSERGWSKRSEQNASSPARKASIALADGGQERPGSPPPTTTENSEETKDLKRARESPLRSAAEGRKGSEHKEKSYVAALFGSYSSPLFAAAF